MGKSLLEVLRTVALDADEQSAFEADPSGYLGQHGYQDVPAEDLTEAVGLMADTLPPDTAEALGPTGDPGAGEGGPGWVDVLQRLDDPDAATTDTVDVAEADTLAPESVTVEEDSSSFGDVDFDSGTDDALEDVASPSSEPDETEDDPASLETIDAGDDPTGNEVDFGAGSTSPGSGTASAPDTEVPSEDDALGDDAATDNMDFGNLSEPPVMEDMVDDQPLGGDDFDAAEDFADQIQQDDPDDLSDLDDLDIGSF